VAAGGPAGVSLPASMSARVRAVRPGTSADQQAAGCARPPRSLLARSRAETQGPCRRRSDRARQCDAGDLMSAEPQRQPEAPSRDGDGTADLTAGSTPAPQSAASAPLLEVEHLKVFFPIKSGIVVDRTVGQVHAVDDVSLDLK